MSDKNRVMDDGNYLNQRGFKSLIF